MQHQLCFLNIGGIKRTKQFFTELFQAKRVAALFFNQTPHCMSPTTVTHQQIALPFQHSSPLYSSLLVLYF